MRLTSTLDAFRSYPITRSCPAMLYTTGRPEASDPSSSRTHGYLLSIGDTPRRYYRTVSRRSEPSSCRSLMDEQPNLWGLLHPQDDLSRQRCTKPRGRCVFESNTNHNRAKLPSTYGYACAQLIVFLLILNPRHRRRVKSDFPPNFLPAANAFCCLGKSASAELGINNLGRVIL